MPTIKKEVVDVPTQRKQIKAHLLKGQSITPIDALRMYGCLRLGARIWELRHQERMPIVTRITAHPNNPKKHFATYFLGDVSYTHNSGKKKPAKKEGLFKTILNFFTK